MTVNFDIGICTFRREAVVDSLRSLAALEREPDWQIRIIVADNDDTPSAKELVETVAKELPYPVHYIHAPARNISIARNACLEASGAEFLAFIDDDETVVPGWLKALYEVQQRERAAVIQGLCIAVYAADTPQWMRSGQFHGTRPVWVKGEIITGYSGNVLIHRARDEIRKLRFLEPLGRTGGEDSVYFTSIWQLGGKIAYAPEAIVYDPIPPERSKLPWLLKRRFRMGQTHGMMLLERHGDHVMSRLKLLVLAASKATYCFVLALLTLPFPTQSFGSLIRGMLHVGVISRLLGAKTIELYGHAA